MPMHKRESLIYTVLMCFTMVLWMSMYNVALHMGTLNMEVIREGWLGFPLAYVCAMCLDWFLVSKIAKGFAFRFLVKPESSTMKKVIAVSCCMVVPMVIFMSLYGSNRKCCPKNLSYQRTCNQKLKRQCHNKILWNIGKPDNRKHIPCSAFYAGFQSTV